MLELDIANVAYLIGDQRRACMLVALMEGIPLTAGELARRADISPQSASNHLKLLVKASLVCCEAVGRHRHYQLASDQVAFVLETLGLLAHANGVKAHPKKQHINAKLCAARSCYDHLAGELAIKITRALICKRMIIENDKAFCMTQRGEDFFNRIGIDVSRLASQKRPLIRTCLDWTERQHHIAGSLGCAWLDYLLQHRLVIRSKDIKRALVCTHKGHQWLHKNLDI